MEKQETLPFFWLHLKKCGGESFRKTFSPPYIQTDRVGNPKPFIAVPKEEWNDVLNNFRIPLGEYDFKRMAFAKKYLYTPEEFENMFKFVIVRNPYSRIISAWKYLFKAEQYNPKYITMKNDFESFLLELPAFWFSKRDRHIATHTAPIWNDITDFDGKLLIDKIYKIENIDADIKDINKALCTNVQFFYHENKYAEIKEYQSFYNDRTKKIVENYYGDDIKNLKYIF